MILYVCFGGIPFGFGYLTGCFPLGKAVPPCLGTPQLPVVLCVGTRLCVLRSLHILDHDCALIPHPLHARVPVHSHVTVAIGVVACSVRP